MTDHDQKLGAFGADIENLKKEVNLVRAQSNKNDDDIGKVYNRIVKLESRVSHIESAREEKNRNDRLVTRLLTACVTFTILYILFGKETAMELFKGLF